MTASSRAPFPPSSSKPSATVTTSTGRRLNSRIKVSSKRAHRAKLLSQLDHHLALLADPATNVTQDLYYETLQCCNKLGDFQTAQTLLREVESQTRGISPTTKMYNLALLAAANAQAPLKVALRFYEDLTRKSGLQPNVHTYGALITACARAGDAARALSFLADMQRRGLEPNLVIYTAAISACERGGATDLTSTVFQEMRQKGLLPNVRTYNVILSQRSKRHAEGWVDALDLLRAMREDGITPDAYSYTMAIDACEKAKRWEEVVDIVNEAGPVANIIMLSRKMSALTKLKRWKDALAVFEYDIIRKGLQPDSISYTHALTACTQGGMVDEALSLLRQMHALQERHGGDWSEANLVTYTAVLDTCRRVGRADVGMDLLDEMKRRGVQPNSVTYSIVIELLAGTGQWQRALQLYQSLEAEGIKKDGWLYDSAIRACAEGGQLEAALVLLRESQTAGYTNPYTYGGVLMACGTVSDGNTALEILEEARQDKAIPELNEMLYGATITACQRAGLGAECLRLLALMVSEGVHPNLSVYNIVLGSLCAGGGKQLDKAVHLLALMASAKTRSPTPDAQSYTQVVNALADELRWGPALRLFGKMRAAGFRPDVRTCARVIRACEKNGQWGKALELLDDLRKDEYDFYELALFDQIFKKLLQIAAAGVRKFSPSRGDQRGDYGMGGAESEGEVGEEEKVVGENAVVVEEEEEAEEGVRPVPNPSRVRARR